MPGALFPAVAPPTGPPCLDGVQLQQFVQQVLVPLLPSLQQHMAMALNVVKEPPEGGDLDVLFNGKLNWGCFGVMASAVTEAAAGTLH